MKIKSKYKLHGILAILLLFTPALQAQKVINISGKVIDAHTKRPLPFVNVVFVGKNIGSITDYKGEYSIETKWASDKLQAQFMGYQKQIKPVSSERNQVINFKLTPESFNIKEVKVAAKRLKYRNKGNPAVELIKKVIKNKDINRNESQDFYQYDKDNTVAFALNNIDEKFMKKKAFRKYQFIFKYVDTSELNGKPYLPVFLKETLSKVYYRKSPKAQKEYVIGTKMTGFPSFIDKHGVSSLVDQLFQNIDIYDNTIMLLTDQFVSPISIIAPNIYKFRIIDTLDVNGYNCINLAFQPRNKADFAFGGNLYITNDGKYAVIKVKMRVPNGINLNFVNDLQIVQEFKYVNNKVWMLSRNQIIVDFNITKNGIGMFGKKTDFYNNYVFNQKQNDSVYSGDENTVVDPEAANRTNQFWAKNRLLHLSREEKDTYIMMDSIQQVPAFKSAMNIAMLMLEGYWNFGKVDVGPVNTFYSFNSVEGLRLRVAARTSLKFSKRFRMDGNITYGFKDKKYKYAASALWSLNKKSLNDRPDQTISVTYQNETNFPGMEMLLVNEDNFLLSFKRGVADKILYYKLFKIEYYRNWGNGISTTFDIKHLEQKPGGNWQFNSQDYPLDQLISSDVSATIRFAPNEKYYQSMDYKVPIITRYPIFQLNYIQGFKNIFNSNFSYSKLSVGVFKRLYLGIFGYIDSDVEAGEVFGSKIPYPLLYLHRANQTYSYQLYSYNMMNFLEFVSDKYASYYGDYHLNGFLFNKIPLIKHLKLRGIVSFKALFGELSDKNNPEKTQGLMNFPTDAEGNPTTFTLKGKPYMEASVGIGNIFKVFRVDLVRRLTYLDNPHVSKYGIRARFKIDF